MTGTTISGIHLASVTLISGTTPNPVTVAGGATISASGTGLVGQVGTYWTVFNNGIVEGSGATGTGIYFASSNASGGSIFNESGGTISGTSHGIELGAGTFAGAGTISNDGTILDGSSGTHPAAIYLPGGGYVTNLSGGVISSASTGILGYASFTDTVANQGLITATGNGVFIDTGGSVTNQSGGLIDAGGNGIELLMASGSTYTGSVANLSGGTIIAGGDGIYVSAASALNQGFISAGNDGIVLSGGAGATNAAGGTILGAWGVVLHDGGSVSNASAGTIAGTLGDGIYANGGAVTVLNSGLIETTSTFAAGIVLRSGGLVSNASGGTISAPVDDAIYIGGAAGTVANAALIQSGAFDGVVLWDGGSVTNQAGGTITGATAVDLNAAGFVSNASGGTIVGTTGDGVNASGSVVNAGLISSTDDTGLSVAGQGGSVTNAVGGTITGLSAVEFDSTGGTLTNDGSIIASSTNAAVILAEGGRVINAADAIIDSSSGDGVYVTGDTGTVTNAGTIIGQDAVQFAAGFNADRLIDDPGAVFTGTVSGGATLVSSTLELASGASAGTLTGLGTKYIGFAQVTVDAGASWTLAGSSTLNAGYTLTDSGSLTNAGPLTVAGTLLDEGLLTNSAGISGVVLLSGGTLVNALGATIAGPVAAVYGATGGSAGTVLNAGLLESGSNPTHSAGVALLSGGFVSNATTGTIEGGGVGVIIYNPANTLANAGTLVNDGSIIGLGTHANGVEFDSGGFVSNARGGTIIATNRGVEIDVASAEQTATVVNAGLIDGGSTGIYGGVTGAATVINAGVVTGGGGPSGTYAVQFAAGYADRLVIDPGAVFNGTVSGGNTIGATASSGAAVASTLELASGATAGTLTGIGTKYVDFTQITIDSGATWTLSSVPAGTTITDLGTLIDTGTIAGALSLGAGVYFHNVSGARIVGSGKFAISGGSGARVVNAGVIDPATYGVYLPSGGTVTNVSGGTVVGTVAGVKISGAGGTVVNAGSIYATGVGSSGVALNAGGSVTNQSGGTIDGALYGIDSSNVATVTNSGRIGVTADVGIGLSGGAVTNAATATIDGTGSGIRIYTGGTVVNAGTLSGGSYSVYFHSGFTNRLVVDSGAVFSGTVDGGNTIGAAAVSTLELASGAKGFLTGLGSKYINFGQVTLDAGATWVLDGANTLVAGATLTAGTTLAGNSTLVVNGGLLENGLLTVNEGVLTVGGTAGVNSTLAVDAGATVDLTGESSTANALLVGDASGASGTVDVSGTGALLSSDAPISVGPSAGATALLDISNGGSVFAETGDSSTTAALGLANRGTATVIVTGQGSELTSDGMLYDGRAADASGTLLVENQGSVVLNADLVGDAAELEVGVGNSSTLALTGGEGYATVTSGGVLNSASLIFIGGNGDAGGTLNVTSGTLAGTSTVLGGTVMAADIALGVNTGSTGGGAGFLNIGTGALVETLGTTTTQFTVAIGRDASSSGTATVAGTLIANGQIVVGNTTGATGLLTVDTGGTVTAGDGLFIGNKSDATGTVVVDGGTLISAPAAGGMFVALGVGSAGSGTLVVEGGGTVIATQVSPGGTVGAGPGFDIATSTGGQGTATVTGVGSLLQVNGQLNVGDQGTGWLDVNSGAVVNAGTSSVSIGTRSGGNGTISVESGGTLIGGALDIANTSSGSATGLLSVGSGGTVEVANLTEGDGGTIDVTGGLLSVSGDATIGQASAGAITIEANSRLDVAGTVASGITVDFTANTGVLQIGTIGFKGTIGADLQGDFQQGDTIVITGVTDATAANLLSGNTLQIVSASLGDIDLRLDPEQGFLGDYFHVATSGGNAVVTENTVPCYLEGTRILTDRGEVRVETLRIGDCVVTLDGGKKPIKWIGRRSYSGAIPTGQRDVIPILIKRGALGPKLPKRDLIVSPLHAMYCDGVLVPAEHLVNGVTVLRAPDIDPIRYFHIELDQHDVIYADGAPAETFVDCDSRSMFHNAAEFDSLYPGDATPRWRYCAPRLEGGERLDAIKRAVDRRAGIDLPEQGAPPGRLEGRLDGVESGRISGWAFHPDRPVEPVWLEVLDGDGVIARVYARRYRADLEAAGMGDGRHGFELNLTGQMRTRRELRVRRVEDGVELEGSPLVVEARGGEALLEDARRVIAAAILDPSDEAALDALAVELLHGVDALRRAREGIPRALTSAAGGGGSVRSDSPSPDPSRKRERKYRALIIDSQLPRAEHDAGSQAILSHAAALTALGFQVEFVAAHELARAEHASVALEHAGYVVHRAPRVASAEEVLRRHRNAYDVVYLHRLANAEAYAPLARAWQARARLLYCVADLHHVRLSRQAEVQASAEVADAARAVRVRELNVMRLCDAVITHSTAEAAYLARVAPGASVHVVAWTPQARPRAMPLAARQGVAAIGSWSHEPNVDAVRWLVSDIMPRVWAAAARIELLVVGSDWPARVPWITDPRVRLVGAVTSIETLLGMLRLTVAPLRFGAGLKGKVLDSFACEVPCVMTPVAAEGFPLEGSLPGLVGEDAATLASLIVRLHEESPFHRAAAGDGLLLAAKFSPQAVQAAMAAAVGVRVEAAAYSGG